MKEINNEKDELEINVDSNDETEMDSSANIDNTVSQHIEDDVEVYNMEDDLTVVEELFGDVEVKEQDLLPEEVSEEVKLEDISKGDISYQFSNVASEHVDKELSKEDKEELVDSEDDDFDFDEIAPIILKESQEDLINKSKKKKEKKLKEKKVKANQPSRWSRMSRRSKVATIIGVCMLSVVCGLVIAFNTVFGGVFKDFSKADAQKEKFDTSKQFKGEDIEVVEADEFNWDVIKGDSTYDENVYNILLLGGDNAKTTGTRGNSDTIMIVSIDKNTKKIKVTSIMRDTYVQIPGYRDNKINSAFATGGVPLIKETIEENFKITIDSTVVLNYSTFRVVIDALGGVDDVTINESEARFINKECRKKKVKSELTEGTHDLNAYQALHFARIRKISSDIYGKDDFGRTARQRFVINQVFKKYKDLSYTELAKLASKVLKEVEVDKNLRKDIFLLIQVVMKFNAEQIEEFRIPMDNYYTFADVPISGTGKSMNVVKIDDDLEANIDGLHLFIYGTDLYGTDFEEEEEEDSDSVKATEGTSRRNSSSSTTSPTARQSSSSSRNSTSTRNSSGSSKSSSTSNNSTSGRTGSSYTTSTPTASASSTYGYN